MLSQQVDIRLSVKQPEDETPCSCCDAKLVPNLPTSSDVTIPFSDLSKWKTVFTYMPAIETIDMMPRPLEAMDAQILPWLVQLVLVKYSLTVKKFSLPHYNDHLHGVLSHYELPQLQGINVKYMTVDLSGRSSRSHPT